MSSGYQLTGGTNDVNPQPLRCRVTPASITTGATGPTAQTATVALPIPVQRLGTGGRAQVLEILKWTYDASITPAGGALGSAAVKICLSTRSNSTTPPNYGVADPYSIDYVAESVPTAIAALTGTGVTANLISFYKSGMRDLTDGAGHGVLFGMDTLYIQCQWIASSTAGAGTAIGDLNICIWYRWKNVGFSEYVGMVTSS